MTIAKAKKKFEALKTAILKDGKVDMAEVNVLISFIEPYVNSSNSRFCKFMSTLHACKADGKITDEESDMLAKEIDDIMRFLAVEAAIEKVLAYGVAALVAFAIVYKLLS